MASDVSALREWRCPECGNVTDYREDCPHGCCRYSRECSTVHDYSYRPTPIFHGDGPLYLGAEIEIEQPYRNDGASTRLATHALGRLGYLKRDATIDHGFEIVTHPMSYPWALEHFPWPMLDDLHDEGCSTPSNVGMHVHLSRDGFVSPAHVYRWLKLVYRNRDQVTALAGRTSGYATFTQDDRRAALSYAKREGSSQRHAAINTGNRDTLELRVFAASLEPAVVRAAFGFAAASVDYTRGLTIGDIHHRHGWDWAPFTDWVATRPAYAPLTRRLHALGLTTTKADASGVEVPACAS